MKARVIFKQKSPKANNIKELLSVLRELVSGTNVTTAEVYIVLRERQLRVMSQPANWLKQKSPHDCSILYEFARDTYDLEVVG